MKVVLLAETFSRRTGSLQRVLPKYFVRHHAEVHVITMDLSPYHDSSAFQGFTETLTKGTVGELDGFQLHVLGHRMVLGYPRMIGLAGKLRSIRPDIVQCQAAIGWIPLDAACLKARYGFKLFTGNHNALSTAASTLDKTVKMRAKAKMLRFIPGRLASYATELCYAVTVDCADIAWRHYGVQKSKVVTMHLGVDTDFFHPDNSEEGLREREAIRKLLGFEQTDVLCIYTGKMTEDKRALTLAEAVGRLRDSGKPYSALFIGNGVQRERIAKKPYCRVIDLMEFSKMAGYFRAADIAVWTGNESSSQLDAAACGIPIIISDLVFYRDHVNGNGLVFHFGDVDDLVARLLDLESPAERARLGEFGARKMALTFTWDYVAKQRIAHYEASLGKSAQRQNRQERYQANSSGEA
jgi:glycosyltransferase involved in cell wall biosynthesis